LFTPGCLGQFGASIGKQIADGDNFHVRMILKSKLGCKSTNAMTNEPDSDFTVGNWLPTPRAFRSFRNLFKSLNGLFFSECCGAQPERDRADACRLQEITAC